MKNQNSKQATIPSNILAKQIIQFLVCNSSTSKSLHEILQQLSIKKNLSYEKFTSYIQAELTSSKAQLSKVIDSIKYLSRKCIEVNNSIFQIKSIVNGFRKYFNKYFQKQIICAKTRKQLINKLIKDYFSFSGLFCVLISELISSLHAKFSAQEKQLYEKLTFQLVIQTVKDRNLSKQDSQKCCLIVQQMNLYHRFKTQDLVFICRNADFQQILSFFKQKDGKIRKQLADAYIIKQTSKNQKKVEKFISKLNLKAQSYPQLVKNANKKCLRYLLNTQPIYSIDLKIKGRTQIIQTLVQILLEQRKQKQAIHFINKHGISKFYHLNQGDNRSYNKNILQKYDQFLPTETIIHNCTSNKDNYEEYFTLDDLGFKQSNVIFVNRQNLKKQILHNIMNSPEFGIDTETAPVYSPYQNKQMQTIQIAVNYRKIDKQQNKETVIKWAYIIDVPDLMQFQLFRSWLEQLCINYKGKIVGHTVKTDFKNLINQIGLKLPQDQLQDLNFIDIGQKFKQKFNETKSSLEYICNYVLKRKLSKFQQCSGWQNRPLRKAQLHYAAMDAVLPLRIYKKFL